MSSVSRRLRRAGAETVVRIKDAPADLRDVLADPHDRLPPAYLRKRVGRTSSRSEFTHVGDVVTGDIVRVLAGAQPLPNWRVLDFGCGAGRLARRMVQRFPEFVGADVDGEAVEWCSKYLSGRYVHIGPTPPLPFDKASFDLVYAISVFTHFDEQMQDAWLQELHRVIRPQGWLLVTTHAPALDFELGDLSPMVREQIGASGFAFFQGRRFNESAAFHAEDYLRRHWTRWFEMSRFEPFGVGGFQDASLLRARTTS